MLLRDRNKTYSKLGLDAHTYSGLLGAVMSWTAPCLLSFESSVGVSNHQGNRTGTQNMKIPHIGNPKEDPPMFLKLRSGSATENPRRPTEDLGVSSAEDRGTARWFDACLRLHTDASQGSKYPILQDFGPKNHTSSGFWDQSS